MADVARPTNDIHLAFEEITIAEGLKPMGYRSALFGKWHLGSRLEWSPMDQGFDEFFGVLHSNDMTPLNSIGGKQMIENPVDASDSDRTLHPGSRSIHGMKTGTIRFLYLPHSFPHVPLFVSPRFDGRSDAGLYGDVVETIDWSTGEILAALDEYGLVRIRWLFSPRTTGPGLREVRAFIATAKAHPGKAGSASHSWRIGRAKFRQAR